MEINFDDVQCLRYELGEVPKTTVKKYLPIGSNIVKHIVEIEPCSYESFCSFFAKYSRCPTWDEIKVKYRREDT